MKDIACRTYRSSRKLHQSREPIERDHMAVYNYKTQQWVTGDKARVVRIAQIEGTLELLITDGERYLAFEGIKTTVAEAVAAYEDELTTLMTERDAS